VLLCFKAYHARHARHFDFQIFKTEAALFAASTYFGGQKKPRQFSVGAIFFAIPPEIMITKFFYIVTHIVTTGYEKKYMIQ